MYFHSYLMFVSYLFWWFLLQLLYVEDANTSYTCRSRTDQLAQTRRASSKQTLHVTLNSVTDLLESVTTTWSLSLSGSTPWMPEFDRLWDGVSPHNVYPSYSAAMLDEKKVELVGSRENGRVFVRGHRAESRLYVAGARTG